MEGLLGLCGRRFRRAQLDVAGTRKDTFGPFLSRTTVLGWSGCPTFPEKLEPFRGTWARPYTVSTQKELQSTP